MKQIKLLFLLTVMAAVLTGCFGKKTQIQCLPCQVDKGDDWGFVDAKGNVSCKDMFKKNNFVSAVIDGCFTVEEDNDLYTLYKYDAKKPKVLLEDLRHVGVMGYGLIPVTPKDGKIMVVDKNGKEVFTLDEIDGKRVLACSGRFNDDGYMEVGVYASTEDDDLSIGLVDSKGNVVLKPIYSDMAYFSKDLIKVEKETADGEEEFYINIKGEKNTLWKSDKAYSYRDGYMVLEDEDRTTIYDLKGKEILKCKSDKVKRIVSIKDGLFVFYNSSWEEGVMNLKGETVLSAKYEHIILTDKGILALRENGKDWELFDKKGESKESFDDYKQIREVDGFGLIASESNYKDYYVLGSDMKPCNKNEFYNIEDGMLGNDGVYTDYFGYEEIVQTVVNGITSDLKAKGYELGRSISKISDIVNNEKPDDYRNYSYNHEVSRVNDIFYRIFTYVHFDSPMTEDHYTTESMYDYTDYWNMPHYSTRQKFDHATWNEFANLDKIEFTVYVSGNDESTRVKELTKRFRTAFAAEFKKENEDTYRYGEQTIEISGYSSRIEIIVSYDFESEIGREGFISDAEEVDMEEYEATILAREAACAEELAAEW